MMVVPVDDVQRQEQGSVMRCGIQVADYEYVHEKTKTEYQVSCENPQDETLLHCFQRWSIYNLNRPGLSRKSVMCNPVIPK